MGYQAHRGHDQALPHGKIKCRQQGYHGIYISEYTRDKHQRRISRQTDQSKQRGRERGYIRQYIKI